METNTSQYLKITSCVFRHGNNKIFSVSPFQLILKTILKAFVFKAFLSLTLSFPKASSSSHTDHFTDPPTQAMYFRVVCMLPLVGLPQPSMSASEPPVVTKDMSLNYGWPPRQWSWKNEEATSKGLIH